MSSETSAIRTQTPGNCPKRNKLHLEHIESLKTRKFLLTSVAIILMCSILNIPVIRFNIHFDISVYVYIDFSPFSSRVFPLSVPEKGIPSYAS